MTPRGPNGECRFADVVGRAAHVGNIATGEITEELPDKPVQAIAGGKARAKALDPARRREIAKTVAARWGRSCRR